MLHNYIQVHSPLDYIAVISILISFLASVWSIGDMNTSSKRLVFSNQLLLFQIINILLLFYTFYFYYYSASFVVLRTIDILGDTLIYGVAITNLRILKLYQQVSQDITDRKIQIIGVVFTLLYVGAVAASIIQLISNNTVVSAVQLIAVIVLSIFTIVYNTAQGIYLIWLVSSPTHRKDSPRIALRRANILIISMMFMDFLALMLYIVQNYFSLSQTELSDLGIIATSIIGIHYSNLQYMFKILNKSGNGKTSDQKSPNKVSQFISKLWQKKEEEDDELEDQFSQFQSVAGSPN